LRRRAAIFSSSLVVLFSLLQVCQFVDVVDFICPLLHKVHILG